MQNFEAGPSPTRALVDLANLRHNYQVLARRASGISLFAVVKANAYGHGAVPVAETLVSEGAAGLAVATVPEGIELRNAGLSNRILVFGAPRRASIALCSAYDLEPFVTSVESIDLIRGAGTLRVHLHIDTGMGRLGVRPDQAAEAVRALEALPNVAMAGVSTHFANAGNPADAFSVRQWETFLGALKMAGGAPAPIHLASSSAIFTVPDSVDPARIGYARPGIGLYGLLDLPFGISSDAFRPVMTLVSEVAQVKTVPEGTPISYEGRWRAERATRIATISAGYADGYPRNLTNRGLIGLGGALFTVSGTVCMDLLMVDIGPEGDAAVEVAPGDRAVLFGVGGPSAVELAALAGTIPYELVCRVGSRVPRIYLQDASDSSTDQ